MRKIAVFRYKNDVRLFGSFEDFNVGGVSQTQIADRDSLVAEVLCYPLGQLRRELRVEPQFHGTTTG